MKYSVLEPFREYLYEKLPKNTASTYYGAVKKLLQDCNFSNAEEISCEFLERELPRRFATKNEYSAAKNGLKHLQKLYPQLKLPSEDTFRSQSLHKRNFSKRPKKVMYLHPTQRKINQIQDEKLKYAYRLSLISGLRVSELADLEGRDLTFCEGQIQVTVRKGKGGHGGTISCRFDPYLYQRLQAFVQEQPESEEKLFYGERKLRKEAEQLGFECHDLRRIYAMELKKELKKEMTAKEADQIVQERLRHNRFSTTKRYLYNRKLKLEYEKQRKKDGSISSSGEKVRYTEKAEDRYKPEQEQE